MAGVEISDRNVGPEKEVEALPLVNVGLAVCCKLNEPALIDFESRFED